MILASIYTLWAFSLSALSASPTPSAEPDSAALQLEDVIITAPTSLSPVARPKDGSFTLRSNALANMPQFMGNADPIRLMQALPMAVTNSDLSAGIYVQGCENSQNSVTIDGVQLFNPMHMLGLFSVFNTPHFSSFSISPNSHRASDQNFIGASIEATTSDSLAIHPSLQGSIGLIDTHITARCPLSLNNSSISLSGRLTYVDLLFGKALKIDNSYLKYGFHDWNLTWLQRLSHHWRLKLSAYLGYDNMRLPDDNYAMDTRFGWHNLLVAAKAYSSHQSHTLGFSLYGNRFNLRYSDMYIELPSSISDFSYRGILETGALATSFNVHARRERQQMPRRNGEQTVFSARWALEASLAADWTWRPKDSHWSAILGMKLAAYRTFSFTRFYPLPAATLRWNPSPMLSLSAHFGLYVQFIHKIQESTMGMPTDFWIIADRNFHPQTARAASISAVGSIFDGWLDYSLELYWRDMSNMADYNGALFNVLNAGYVPLDDVIVGRGRAWGLSAMLKKNYGSFQGWISYTYGHTRQNFPALGSDWYPSSHDRTHDFSINLLWRLLPQLTASLSWVYATGFPYTEPLYGYMIGENIVCEFKPRNSSRLPDYHRLDFSLNWEISSGKRFQQGLNLSVYNLYARSNVLFRYVAYLPEQGIVHKEWSLRSLLPSISYYFAF